MAVAMGVFGYTGTINIIMSEPQHRTLLGHDRLSTVLYAWHIG